MSSSQGQQNGDGKGPVYVNYKQMLSKVASRREKPALRKYGEYMLDGNSVYINTSSGFPSPDVFPIVEANFITRDGSVIHIDKSLMVEQLQYGLSKGSAALREWMIEFQRRVHSPPTLQAPDHPGAFDLIISTGSNESCFLTFSLLLDEGDWMLTEEATYPTALNIVQPMSIQVKGIPSDAEGMITKDLEEEMTSWNERHPGCPKPKLMYVIPSGGNPTGVTWSEGRRREIYEVSRKHGLMIVEDDAYFFLQFKRPMVPSFLSLDIDGRVIRLDTFSKVVAPGMRAAVISGPKPLLYKLSLHKDVSSLAPSGLTQAVLLQLLRHWGYDGFLRHIDDVMEFYKNRADMAVKTAEKYLTGLAEWNRPGGGMFLWMKLLAVSDAQRVVERMLQEHVAMVPGAPFSAEENMAAYLRISFSIATPDQLDKAFECLARVLRELQASE